MMACKIRGETARERQRQMRLPPMAYNYAVKNLMLHAARDRRKRKTMKPYTLMIDIVS